MSNPTLPQVIASANADTKINELFKAAAPALIFGRDADTCTGLVWGYCGGRWGGISIPAGTVTATASNTNYVVLNKTTGGVSISTANTNWNNSSTYARIAKLTAGASTITDEEDYRGGDGGTQQAGAVTGASYNSVGVFTKAQSVAYYPLAIYLGDVDFDARNSNNFRLLVTEDCEIQKPTFASSGQPMNLLIVQDAYGGHTVTFDTSYYKFDDGAAPVINEDPYGRSVVSCLHDTTDDVADCSFGLNKS